MPTARSRGPPFIRGTPNGWPPRKCRALWVAIMLRTAATSSPVAVPVPVSGWTATGGKVTSTAT